MTKPSLPAGVAVLERGWLSSNNVVFTRGRTAVVDSGYVSHATQTVALVRRVLSGASLDLIVNTHLHSDHCGGNAALRSAFPAALTMIPPGLAGAVAAWDPELLSFEATGQSCEPFDFDALLRPGERVRLGESDWEIHAAPGHDPHSVILFEPDSATLISADALWENGFGVVFPELDGEPGFAEVAATLDTIESLHPRLVIPGHGAPFSGEAVLHALERARSRLAKLEAQPRRHAAHAMKVLIKFKLLEWQQVSAQSFLEWADAMPYMRRVHRKFFADLPFQGWLEGLLSDLAESGAIARDGAMLRNV